MFQFSGFAFLAECQVFNLTGCPIRKSADQFVCANPRSLSQLITSFIASESLGILHTPLSTFSSFFRRLLLHTQPALVLFFSTYYNN